MIKKRAVTIVLTLLLILASIGLNIFRKVGVIKFPIMSASIMLLATAIFIFGGCMLQTFGKYKISIVLGVMIFFVLCTCLFYALSAVDYLTFAICIYLLIRRQSKTCECLPSCENPLR